MRIACPSCGATYEVPDRLLAGSPRPVRCARCGSTWTPEALAPAEEARSEAAPAMAGAAAPPRFVVPEPEIAAPPARAPLVADRPPPRREPAPEPLAALPEPPPVGGTLALAAAWVATLMVLGGGVAGAWLYRAEIVAAWPAAARLYAALGG